MGYDATFGKSIMKNVRLPKISLLFHFGDEI